MAACPAGPEVTAVKGNTALTNKLYKQLSTAKPNDNVFFSPLSISTVLALLQQGAEGVTATKLREALGIADKECTAKEYKSIMAKINGPLDVTLKMANKVYVADGYTLKQSFKDVAIKSFGADAENIKFVPDNKAAADKMNGWVLENTNQKIKDLIPADALDTDTRLVLINAIYFKGNWLNKFNNASTTDDKFYTTPGVGTPCRMMHQTSKFGYYEHPDLQAKLLKLDYTDPAVSMILILPNKAEDMSKLEGKLQTTDLSKLSDNLNFKQEVIVSLPKFKIETTMDLKDNLMKIGFENMFSPAAEFSGLLEQKQALMVSKVIQKAFIEVNEEGAEAAAATAVLMVTYSLSVRTAPTPVFQADHPFLVLLQVNEHILFYGRINKL